MPPISAQDLQQTQARANNGYICEMYILSTYYRQGHGVKQSDTEAFKWMEKAYSNGACFRGCFERDPVSGQPLEPEDRSQTNLKWALPYGFCGLALLLWDLGTSHAYGFGCERNSVRGLFLMLRALEISDNDIVNDPGAVLCSLASARAIAEGSSGKHVNEVAEWVKNNRREFSIWEAAMPLKQISDVFRALDIAAIACEEFKHMRRCRNCGGESADLKMCECCKLVCYCSKECQKMDWSCGAFPHKHTCRTKTARAIPVPAQLLDDPFALNQLLNSQSEKKLVLSQVRTTAAYFEKLWRPDNSSISTAFTNDCTKLAAENPGMKDAEIMAKVMQMWAASKQNAANNAAEVKKSKRSLGAYKIFYEEVRPKIVAAHPKFTIGEVREKVGEKWKKLSDAERKSYGVRFTASERGR